MSKHLQRDLTALAQMLLGQSSRVEEMVNKACRALREMRSDLAIDVLAQEREVDQQEIRIEEECLKILALHQPVAVDLRRVTTVLKINAELERVGDLAVHIAERTISLADYPHIPLPEMIERMCVLAMAMVHKAMDSFVNADSTSAREVCAADDDVDEYNREMITRLKQTMEQQPTLIEPVMHLFSATRQIERIADHATNIAEDVVYLVEGEILRHQHSVKRDTSTS